MEMITALLVKLGLGGVAGKVVAAVLGGLGAGGAWMLARKILPGLAAKAIGAELKNILGENNLEDRALLVALMRWAEVKKGKGAGQEKMAMVKGKVKAIFRLSDQQAGELDSLLEAVFLAAKEEVEKAAGYK